MPNFLPAIFAFLFWGKTTADHEDRTRHSSWMRTLIFLVLTICVGLIYVKTLEIITFTNYIDLRGVEMANQRTSPDYIQITIDNNLEQDNIKPGIVKNKLLLHKQDTAEKSSVYDGSMRGRRASATEVLYNLSNAPEILNKYVRSKTYYKPVPDFPWEKALYSMGGYQFSETYNIDSLCSLLQEVDGQKYFSIIYQKNVPDFLPFRSVPPVYKNDTILSNAYVKMRSFFSTQCSWTNPKPAEIFGGDGFISFNGISHKRVGNDSYTPFSLPYSTSHFNRLSYITAGDISQGILQLQLHSDIQVSDIYVNFSTPVEFVQLPFTPDAINPYGFHVSDSTTISQIIDKDLRLYLKFPALANKQLVRSLILTTLLTALASLFLSNLYFWLRRLIRTKLGEEKREPALGKRQKIARGLHNALIVLILLVLLFFAIIIYRSYFIYVSRPFLIWGWVIFIAAVLLFFTLEYLLYRYAKSDPPTSTSDTD